MGNYRIPERERALREYRNNPKIIHSSCGTKFELSSQDAALLAEILREQEEFCEDTLLDGSHTESSSCPKLMFLQNRIMPQIRVSKECLHALREDLASKVKSQGKVVLEPTRLQVTFLLQAVEWMDILQGDMNVVDIARFRLSRLFDRLSGERNFEFDFWLGAIYIDERFGLSGVDAYSI